MKTVLASFTWALVLMAGFGSAVRRAGPADRRHHRHGHDERWTVDAGRDGGGHVAGAAGRAVDRDRRERHLRPSRAAAGRLHVTFEMSGMATVKRADRRRRSDARSPSTSTMALAGVAGGVTVAAETAPVVNNPTVGANYTQALIDSLPIGRTPFTHRRTRARPDRQHAERRPGHHRRRVRLRQRVPDRRRRHQRQPVRQRTTTCSSRTPIEETQVLTSGISAEYGRFSGGVINVVTKSGGNIFSGSFAHEPHQPVVDRRDAVRDARRGRDRQARSILRGHVRRADRQRPAPVVLRRRPLRRTTETPITLAQTGIAVRPQASTTSAARSRSPARRAEPHGAGQLSPTTHGAGRPAAASAVAIDPRTLDRRDSCRTTLLVAQLERRALDRSCSRRAQFSQKTARLPRRRRHRAPTSSTRRSCTRRPRRRPGGPALQRAVLRRDRSRGSQQPADRRAASRTSCRRGRSGSHDLKGGVERFRSTDTRRQLAVVDRLRVLRRLPARCRRRAGASTRRDGSFRCFVPGDVAAATTGCRRAARSSTSRRRRSTSQDRWTAEHAADVRPRRALRARPQRGDRRHHRRRHRHDGAAAGGHLRRRRATAASCCRRTYAHYAGKYSEAQFANNTDVGNPEPASRSDYTGPAGTGPRLRARLRSGQLHGRSSRDVPDRERRSSRTVCRRR